MPSHPQNGHTHKQTAAAATWTINHQLNRRVGVSTYINFDGKLQAVLPREVEIVSDTQVVIRFSAAQSGEARLS